MKTQLLSTTRLEFAVPTVQRIGIAGVCALLLVAGCAKRPNEVDQLRAKEENNSVQIERFAKALQQREAESAELKRAFEAESKARVKEQEERASSIKMLDQRLSQTESRTASNTAALLEKLLQLSQRLDVLSNELRIPRTIEQTNVAALRGAMFLRKRSGESLSLPGVKVRIVATNCLEAWNTHVKPRREYVNIISREAKSWSGLTELGGGLGGVRDPFGGSWNYGVRAGMRQFSTDARAFESALDSQEVFASAVSGSDGKYELGWDKLKKLNGDDVYLFGHFVAEQMVAAWFVPVKLERGQAVQVDLAPANAWVVLESDKLP